MRKVLGVERPESPSANTSLLLRRASENVRQTLDIRATITEKLLPIVSANVMLCGLDPVVTDPYVCLTNVELT